MILIDPVRTGTKSRLFGPATHCFTVVSQASVDSLPATVCRRSFVPPFAFLASFVLNIPVTWCLMIWRESELNTKAAKIAKGRALFDCAWVYSQQPSIFSQR